MLGRMNQAPGGPLHAYLQRGFREVPRALGVGVAGLGFLAWGLVAADEATIVWGVVFVGAIAILSITAALLERRSDMRAGRAFSMVRHAVPGPTTTRNEDLAELRLRSERIEHELDEHRRRDEA
jgi:hypothetical protein